jgi:hypothetical protein
VKICESLLRLIASIALPPPLYCPSKKVQRKILHYCTTEPHTQAAYFTALFIIIPVVFSKKLKVQCHKIFQNFTTTFATKRMKLKNLCFCSF